MTLSLTPQSLSGAEILTPEPVPSVATDSGFLALIALGEMVLAVDVADVREVIPRPATFHRIPAAGPLVCGAVVLRDQIIPVLNLPELLGGGDQANVVVVLRAGRRLLGFLADAALGIVPVTDVRRQAVFAHKSTDMQDILPEVFLMGARVINRLNPLALLALPGIPTVMDGSGDRPAPDALRHFLTFQAEDTFLCVPVDQVDAIIPFGPITTGSMSIGLSYGSVERHGLIMAMLDPLAAIGTRTGGDIPQAAAGVVIKFGDGGRMALRADRVCDILRVPASEISAFPPALAARQDLISGAIANASGVHHIILNVPALRADADFANFAALAHRTGDGSDGPDIAADGVKDTVLIFQAAGQFALRISEVEEILPLPDGWQDVAPDFAGHLRNINHRGRLIPVYAAAVRLGGAFAWPSGRAGILVLAQGDIHYGLLVERLTAIEQALRRYDNAEAAQSGAPPKLVQRLQGGTAGLVTLLTREDLIPT